MAQQPLFSSLADFGPLRSNLIWLAYVLTPICASSHFFCPKATFRQKNIGTSLRRKYLPSKLYFSLYSDRGLLQWLRFISACVFFLLLHIFGRLLKHYSYSFSGGFALNWEQEITEKMNGSFDYVKRHQEVKTLRWINGTFLAGDEVIVKQLIAVGDIVAKRRISPITKAEAPNNTRSGFDKTDDERKSHGTPPFPYRCDFASMVQGSAP